MDEAGKWFQRLNTKSDGSSVITDGITGMFSEVFATATEETVKDALAKGAKSISLTGLLSSGIGNLIGGATSIGG